MRIAIASDHAAYELKALLAEWLRGEGHEVADLGTNGPESVDYPDYGYALADAVATGGAQSGDGRPVPGAGPAFDESADDGVDQRAAGAEIRQFAQCRQRRQLEDAALPRLGHQHPPSEPRQISRAQPLHGSEGGWIGFEQSRHAGNRTPHQNLVTRDDPQSGGQTASDTALGRA